MNGCAATWTGHIEEQEAPLVAAAAATTTTATTRAGMLGAMMCEEPPSDPDVLQASPPPSFRKLAAMRPAARAGLQRTRSAQPSRSPDLEAPLGGGGGVGSLRVPGALGGLLQLHSPMSALATDLDAGLCVRQDGCVALA